MPASRRNYQRKRKLVQENAESDSVEFTPVKKLRWDREEDDGGERDVEEPETDPEDDTQQLCIAVTSTGYMLRYLCVVEFIRTIHLGTSWAARSFTPSVVLCILWRTP